MVFMPLYQWGALFVVSIACGLLAGFLLYARPKIVR